MKVAALLVVAPVRKVASDQVASDGVHYQEEDVSMLRKGDISVRMPPS
jgi:hypothetical protein